MRGALEPLVRDGSLRWLPDYVGGVEGDLGDGRSPRWAYEYQAGEEGLGVLVSANGTVVNATEVETTPRPALPDDPVESTQALQTAADEHPTWRDVPPQAGVAYALYHDEGRERPVWALGLHTETDGRRVVFVDAGTGEDLGVSEDGRDPITPRGRGIGPQTPPRTAGTFNGSLALSGGDQSWGVFLQRGGHPELAVLLRLDEPVTGTVNATLTSEGQALVELEAGPTDPEARAAWPLPDAGGYQVELELRRGADQDYTVHWCAPGIDGGDERTPACRAPGR